MGNAIQLLPDSIANQIAAGEVIQRPASAVKELLENAVDSEATEIHLIVKDSGKTLIRVIDNGSGMGESDVRLALERHATSKIRTAADLFNIRTMGFRGEALPSIASISQMEIKTKTREDELGTQLIVEGSEVKEQTPCQTPNGTSISVKNLFYNVPARRKFLKSDRVELRHIIDEFERAAIPNPHIKFTFTHNDNELFHLESTVLRGRIVGIFGKRYEDKLAPVQEQTDILNLRGFICKPEAAKKTRGEQFFFVNGRFIKSAYLHHAVRETMRELIPHDSHPGYFIEFQVDPEFIDVNIHPTKTEIKFEDERTVYAILKSAVRQAAGKYNITPSLDFERETGFDSHSSSKPVKPPEVKVNPDYNPFRQEKGFSAYSDADQKRRENYEKMFKTDDDFGGEGNSADDDSAGSGSGRGSQELFRGDRSDQAEPVRREFLSFLNRYLIVNAGDKLLLIHQSRAHERILYERFSKMLDKRSTPSQQSLFPQQVSFSKADADLIKELQTDLKQLGFELSEFGDSTFVVQGLPDYASYHDPQELLEGVLEHYKNNLQKLKLDRKEAFARSLAKRTAIQSGKKLEREEAELLITELFECENPNTSPSGSPIIKPLSADEVNERF